MISKGGLITCFISCTVSYAADSADTLNEIAAYNGIPTITVELPDVASNNSPQNTITDCKDTLIKNNGINTIWYGEDKERKQSNHRSKFCKYSSKALCCLGCFVPGSIIGGVYTGLSIYNSPSAIVLGVVVGSAVNIFGAMLCTACCTMEDCYWRQDESSQN